MDSNFEADLLKDVVLESQEGLDAFDRELLALERGESSVEGLHKLFRIAHTLKGTSGCLGLTRVETLAHSGESLLSLMREGKIAPGRDVVGALLRFADTLRIHLRSLAGEGEPPQDDAGLIRDLQALAEANGAIPIERPAPVPVVTPLAAPAPSPTPRPTQAETAIRVDVHHLDRLMDLVGELVLARNQILQFAGQQEDAGLLAATQRLNLITTQLQESVMKTRMQPVSNIWSRFPRIVRDLSQELGKNIGLVMEGKETELDRTIIEAIKDPLTHLLRNALDHGLEKPEVRRAAGKPEQGRLSLRAFHQGGQVNIEMADDGAGIHRDKVLKRAMEKGIVTAEQAPRLTDREVYALLFAPGFSTAEKVTNLSGRGVGMDVVKRNVEQVGGSVDLQSEAGRSTTVRIKIPLTLAIIPALIVECARNRYAIPQSSLLELVRVDPEGGAQKIEYIDAAPVYRLRGNLLPLIYLDQELGLAESARDSRRTVYILVLQSEGCQFGLVVDSIRDTEEIVVKPLGKELKNLSVYAGATIMGDGLVALILDIPGLARRAKVVSDVRAAAQEAQAGKSRRESDLQSLLLFSTADSGQAAIPLARVARLEEISHADVERAGRREVLQYRGEIMPLIWMNLESQLSAGKLQVVVCNYGSARVGLVVDRILDAIDDSAVLQPGTSRPGILGSAIVKKRVTDFIDIDGVVRNAGSYV
jgi:two-component system chemotaxis sensor kinase CheA